MLFAILGGMKEPVDWNKFTLLWRQTSMVVESKSSGPCLSERGDTNVCHDEKKKRKV